MRLGCQLISESNNNLNRLTLLSFNKAMGAIYKINVTFLLNIR
jgi:hypothetical protein